MQKRIIREKEKRVEHEKQVEENINNQVMKCIKEDLANQKQL